MKFSCFYEFKKNSCRGNYMRKYGTLIIVGGCGWWLCGCRWYRGTRSKIIGTHWSCTFAVRILRIKSFATCQTIMNGLKCNYLNK